MLIKIKYDLIIMKSRKIMKSKELKKSMKSKKLIKYKISKTIKNKKINHKGGSDSSIKNTLKKILKFSNKGKPHKTGYLKKLIDKGNEPITGNDIKTFCDQIIKLIDILKYTPMGENLLYTGLIIKLLMGDKNELKEYIDYYEIPKYIDAFPPHFDFNGIMRELQYYPLYKEAYNTYDKTLSGKNTNISEDSIAHKINEILKLYSEIKAGRAF